LFVNGLASNGKKLKESITTRVLIKRNFIGSPVYWVGFIGTHQTFKSELDV